MTGEFTDRDRRALRSVAVQFFVNGAIYASFIPRLPEIRDRVGVSVTGIGIILAAAAATGLLGSVIVTRAIDRFGTRTVIVVASVLLSLALGVVGLSTTAALLLVALGTMAMLDVLVDVSMNMQGSWLSARRHAPVMNRLHGLWSLGTLIGGAASAQIAAVGVGLRAHLLIAAALMLVLITYVGTGLLAQDEQHAELASSTQGAAPTDDATARATPPVVPLSLLAFGLAGFYSVAIESGSTDWAAFRLSDDFGVGPGVAALGYVAVTVGMTAGRFAGDWASVRLGGRRLRHLSLALVGGGMAIAAFAPLEAPVLIGYLAAGMGAATMIPVLYDEAAKRPGRPGAGLGALTAGLRIALLAVPVLVGALAGAFDDVGIAVALVTLPSVVGFHLATRRLD